MLILFPFELVYSDEEVIVDFTISTLVLRNPRVLRPTAEVIDIEIIEEEIIHINTPSSPKDSQSTSAFEDEDIDTQEYPGSFISYSQPQGVILRLEYPEQAKPKGIKKSRAEALVGRYFNTEHIRAAVFLLIADPEEQFDLR